MTNVPPHPPHTMKTNVLCPQAERSVNSCTHKAAVGCVEACLRCTHLGSRTTHAVTISASVVDCHCHPVHPVQAVPCSGHETACTFSWAPPVIPTEESPFLWPLWRMISSSESNTPTRKVPPPLLLREQRPCWSNSGCSFRSFCPPPPYKLHPCPSSCRCRDRINLGPNFNSVPNVVQPHKTWVW